MSGDTRDKSTDSRRKTVSKGDDSKTTAGQPAKFKSTARSRTGAGSSGNVKPAAPPPVIDVVMERRGRGYAVMLGERMTSAGEDGDSFYRAVLLALGQARGDTVASHDIQVLRNDVADTLMPRLNSGLLRNWWQNRKRRTGLTPERYLERYIRSPGSWDEPLAQLLPVIVPSCATWRRLGGKRLMVDMPGYGRFAEPNRKPLVVAVRASDLWHDFVKGDATVFAPMQPQVLRDRSLPISSLTRPVRMTLDHPRDAVEMRSVPTHLTVVFAELASIDAAKDQRNLLLLPSATALVNSCASLPAIEVSLVFDDQIGTTYIVTETGSHATVRFIFARGVSCPAIDVLNSLKRAADVKQASLMTALHELMTPTEPDARSPARRAAMARFWSDLSDDVRRRVLAGFSGREGLAAIELDVVRELKSGVEPASVALAADMLSAALDLWQIRGDISQIPFSFWRAEMAREMPSVPRGLDFMDARARVQDSFKRWKIVYADVKRWLADPAIGGNAELSEATRDCIIGALTRGDETGAPVPASLREVAAHELRSRLFSLHQKFTQQGNQKQVDSPAAITAAMTQCAELLCGGGNADRAMADEAAAPVAPVVIAPVSVLWPQLVADTARDVLHLDGRAARDHTVNLSLMNRRATLVVDHPDDILQMNSIPADLTVRLDPSGPGSVGSDQRWLYIAPGNSEFLGKSGALPSISVTLSKGEKRGWQVYTIFDIGQRIGCRFIFTGPVAPRIRSALAALMQAADEKWKAFRDIYSDLSNDAQIGAWDVERRAVAAAFWNAFPESIKQRALGYYGRNDASRTLLEKLDVGDVLTRSRSAADLAMARQVLMSALDYWDEHGELDDVAVPFWDDVIRQEALRQPSPANFSAMLEIALQAHRQWQETAPLFDDMLQWLAQPALEADIEYRQLRHCLQRATRRAAGLLIDAPDVAGDSVAQSSAAQIRARLVQVRQAVQASDEMMAVMPMAMTSSQIWPRMRPWMARISGAEPVLLAANADRLDESTIAGHCAPAGMGVHAVSYRLDAALAATRIADLFAIESALLADGAYPIEILGKSEDAADDGAEDGQRWWRSYRFSGAWKYDMHQRAWHRAQHEMSVEGSVIAQREAFDVHMSALFEDMASAQSLYFFSNDRQQIELSNRATYVLASQSQFAQRTVHLLGAGGLLMLPPGLSGTVTIDLSRLDNDASAQLEVAPPLLARLQPQTSVDIDGKTFLRYRHMDDEALTLQIGPQESQHPFCMTLTSQLQELARQQLIYDLADEIKNVVLVDALLDDEIVLPPMTRDVFIYPLGKSPRFVIHELGPARMQLLASPPPGAVTAELRVRLDFSLTILPRYGASDLVLGPTGYTTGAVRDHQNDGTFLLCCTPGTVLDRRVWNQSIAAIKQVHDRYVDYMLDWDDRLCHGHKFNTRDMLTVKNYAVALARHSDETMVQRAALLSMVVGLQQQERLVDQQPGYSLDMSEGRRQVSTVVGQMLMFSFSDKFDDISLEQWTSLVQASDTPLMVARLIGIYVDRAWQRDQDDEFYAGLAGFHSFMHMLTGDTVVEAALGRDEKCIDVALDLIAGNQVSDDLLQQVGLAEIKGEPQHLLRLKLIMVTRRDEKLFDDDPFWRDQLLNDMRRVHVRTRRNNVFNLLASIFSGRGGRDAVMLAYQYQKLSPISSPQALTTAETMPDVVLFEQVSAMKVERGELLFKPNRFTRNSEKPSIDASCRLASTIDWTGALLIFIGEIGTALSKWYINEDGSQRQRYTTMYFQMVKAAGWATQQATGFACQPVAHGAQRFVQMTAPVVGLGMSFNYLAGGLAELIVRPPRTSWTWRRDMRPLSARIPGVRGNKIMQVVDMAGNIYLLMADASRISILQQQMLKPEGSDVISATVSCSSSALGVITAAGEIGTKALLTPAKRFYQAVGISSALLNLCRATVDTLPSGTMRTDDGHHEL